MERTVEEKINEIAELMKDFEKKPSTTVVYPEGVGHSSVECEKTAKGDLKFKFKCYSNDIGGLFMAIDQIPEALKRIEKNILNGNNGGKNEDIDAEGNS